MNITKQGQAGTFESNDIYIIVKPNDKIEIELTSTVYEQFGGDIKTTILNTLTDLGVEFVRVIADDKGALDYTIKARLKAALLRGQE